MFTNYLKVAVRSLLRNKIYVLINTMGMGISLACCLTAYLLIAYNIEFDDYFNADQTEHIAKVVHHRKTAMGKMEKSLVSPINLAPVAAQEIAGIEDFTRFCNQNGIISHKESAFFENIRFADASFLRMFSPGLSQGSYKNFEEQKSIFLSSSIAVKYFADSNPVGETMTVEINNIKYDVIVGGVFEEMPLNISFHIDVLMRIEIYLTAHAIAPSQWDGQHASVLFKLSDIGQSQVVAKQLSKYTQRINESLKDVQSVSFELIPFGQAIAKDEITQSNLRHPIPLVALVIFATLALIILLIACFNLTNTTLALTGKRLKEIGVRKVVGSGRIQIVFQFVIEMVLTVFIATLAGVLLAQLIVPQFALMWQLQFGLAELSKLNLLITLILLLFISALLAGIYPALANSKYKPIDLLKGSKEHAGTTLFSRSLLVIQFSLAVIVLIAGIAFTQNAAYQKELSFGYDIEHILLVTINGEREYDLLKAKIIENPEIEKVAGSSNHIGPYSTVRGIVKLDTTLFKTNIYKVGTGYFDVVGLEIISGRDFNEDIQSDYDAIIVDENFILNQRMVNPMDAQIVYKETPYRVVGIVKNHLSGLKYADNSEHIYLLAKPEDFSRLVVRADPDKLMSVRSYLETEWKKILPGKPFESQLQEEMVYEEANGYNNNLQQIFLFITILGCLLSASGIYALASLNVQKRTKEIGIRKVLGASVQSIVQLLNREFIIILSIAALLGGLGGYYLTDALLSDLYVQHMQIGFFTILVGGLSVFVIGIMATSGTIFKTAVSNPTETLRSE